ncbi:MAG: hypothetical protein KA408_08790 [Flavobacteriales bacterium]|nr:hypothetical protein [Flavobacteriales bacterium]
MRAIRHHVALFLLAILVIAIAPQEVWHAWAHEDGTEHLDDGSATYDSYCEVCDLGILVAIDGAVLSCTLPAKVVIQHTAPPVFNACYGFEPNTDDRGPPEQA